MPILKKIKNKIETAFGKGIRYPVSKYERNLQTILKHQEERMIVIAEVPEQGMAFLKHLEEERTTYQKFTRKITRPHRHAAFKLL
jgi:hypothetical protein